MKFLSFQVSESKFFFRREHKTVKFRKSLMNEPLCSNIWVDLLDFFKDLGILSHDGSKSVWLICKFIIWISQGALRKHSEGADFFPGLATTFPWRKHLRIPWGSLETFSIENVPGSKFAQPWLFKRTSSWLSLNKLNVCNGVTSLRSFHRRK